MKRALVLGGGGLVGMGYHAGALKALEDIGIDAADAELIVGTSAGSVIAAYLGSGWKTGDFYDHAHGNHPDALAPEAQREEIRSLFQPLWTTRAERVRRTLGSWFTVASSRGYWRAGATGRRPSARLRRSFPSGLYSAERTRERFHRDLPLAWPRDGLYICAADLYTGRRFAFGHPHAPAATLPEALLASVAVPGIFPPVRIGRRYYVDGGAFSATSLDVAIDAGCRAILCIAPLGYHAEGASVASDPKIWPVVAMRQLFARWLAREINEARARDVDVLVIRPRLTELKALGTNAMRHYDRVAVTDAAREGALELLQDNRAHPVLQAFRAGAKEPV